MCLLQKIVNFTSSLTQNLFPIRLLNEKCQAHFMVRFHFNDLHKNFVLPLYRMKSKPLLRTWSPLRVMKNCSRYVNRIIFFIAKYVNSTNCNQLTKEYDYITMLHYVNINKMEFLFFIYSIKDFDENHLA